MSDTLLPLTDDELEDARRRAQAFLALPPPYTPNEHAERILRLVAEVLRHRGRQGIDSARLHYHHLEQDRIAGLDPAKGEAVDALKAAMAKLGLRPEQAIDPEALRALLTERCRLCSEFDGTLPKRDRH